MSQNASKLVSEAPSSAKRLSPDARKAQLLHHAMAAFAQAGIERAVHADVAARANVSTPTVFKYFPTRDALVDAILTEIEDAFTNLSGLKSSSMRLQPKELTHLFAGLISALCVNKPNLMKVGLMWSVSFSPIRERYKTFEDMKLDDLENHLSSVQMSRSDARIFFSSMNLLIRMHFDGTSSEARMRYINRLSEMFDSALP